MDKVLIKRDIITTMMNTGIALDPSHFDVYNIRDNICKLCENPRIENFEYSWKIREIPLQGFSL